MSFFNAPLNVPNGSALKLQNTTNDVLSLRASQSAFTGGNFTLYFPNTFGTASQVLQTDGTGNLTWATVSGGAASNVSASNITVGSSNVYISTTAGNVRINAPASETVQLQVSNANVAVFSGSEITLINPTTVSSITESTSTTIGALVVSGGVGIVSNVNIGGNVNVTNNTVLSSNLTVNGAGESTNTSTGSLVVAGGVGVAKNVNVGGNVVISGDLTVNGTTTTINSNIVSIDDPVIELGTSGVADSFDRGIVGLYNTRKLFFGWNNSANVFTFVPDATVSSGSNIVTGTAGKAVFGEIVAGSNVTINNNTQSTNTLSGALVVGGGAGIASNLNVGGNVNITNVTRITESAESSSITTGALIVGGGIGVTRSVYVGANLTVGGQVVYGVDNFTSTSIVSTNATSLWSGSFTATIKHLQPPTNAAQYYHANTSVSYVTGQHMDIFFTRPAANTVATANIDFGSSNLYSGSGAAQYLVFTQPGQSASLVYLSGTDSTKGWRIINTGAQVY